MSENNYLTLESFVLVDSQNQNSLNSYFTENNIANEGGQVDENDFTNLNMYNYPCREDLSSASSSISLVSVGEEDLEQDENFKNHDSVDFNDQCKAIDSENTNSATDDKKENSENIINTNEKKFSLEDKKNFEENITDRDDCNAISWKNLLIHNDNINVPSILPDLTVIENINDSYIIENKNYCEQTELPDNETLDKSLKSEFDESIIVLGKDSITAFKLHANVLSKTKSENLNTDSSSLTNNDDINISKEHMKISIENGDDEIDFRVNIMERDDNAGTWSTNLYVHKDDMEVLHDYNHSEMLSSENIKIENKSSQAEIILKSLDFGITNNDDINISKEHMKISIENGDDEIDFRVNIMERDDNAGTWSTNLYVHKDDMEVLHDYNHSETLPSENIKIENTSSQEEIILKSLDFGIDSIKINTTNLSVSQCDNTNTDNLSVIKSGDINTDNLSKSKSQSSDIINYNTPLKDYKSEKIITDQRSETIDTNVNIVTDDKSQKHDTTIRNISPPILMEDVPQESVIITSIGVRNAENFKSMNAVIIMLFNCPKLRKSLIDYHNNDRIALIDLDARPDINVYDTCFVNDLCQMFSFMAEGKEDETKNVARKVRRYFRNRLDLPSGISYILTKINAVTKSISNEINAYKEKDEIAFFQYKIQNHGFISDLFYGQMSHKIFCQNCHRCYGEEYHPMNSLQLKISDDNQANTLESFVKQYFHISTIIQSTPNAKCCSEPIIKIIKEITHAPEYLFIFLDRKLENGFKSKSYIETDNGIIIPKKNGAVLYSLLSVTDHVETQTLNKFYIKCFSNGWWYVDSLRTRPIQSNEIISEYSTGFMFVKQNES